MSSFTINLRNNDGSISVAAPGIRTTSKATINSRSMNIRAPMRLLRTLWPHTQAGDEFEWVAFPAADVIVLRRKL